MIRTEPDGTRVYADGHRYTPVPDAERVYRRRKPADPQAVRYGGSWFLPLQLLDDESRSLPETRPDDETLEHRATCRCEVCRRPQASLLWARARRRAARRP